RERALAVAPLGRRERAGLGPALVPFRLEALRIVTGHGARGLPVLLRAFKSPRPTGAACTTMPAPRVETATRPSMRGRGTRAVGNEPDSVTGARNEHPARRGPGSASRTPQRVAGPA